MKADAESHADEDRKAREKIDLKNQVDALIHQREKFLEENKDKLSEEDRTSLQNALDGLKSARDAENIEGMKSSMEEVEKIAGSLGEKLYKDAASATQDAGGADDSAAGAAPGGVVSRRMRTSSTPTSRSRMRPVKRPARPRPVKRPRIDDLSLRPVDPAHSSFYQAGSFRAPGFSLSAGLYRN